MKVAMIGGGGIAHIHAPILKRQPGNKIVGIADLNIENAKAIANEYEIENTYDNAEKMIDEQKPDIVHVLVPPQFHKDIAIMALNKGCHVLVEKPIALNVADAKIMKETAEKNNLYLCVNHNALVDHIFEDAMKMAADGVIGDIVTVEAVEVVNADRFPAFLADDAPQKHWTYELFGGPLEDMVPHPISLILGTVPNINEIHTVGLNRGVIHKPWQDELRVILTSEKTIGYISFSLSERPDIATLTIKGTKGMIVAESYNFIMNVRMQSSLPRKFARGMDGLILGYQYLKGSLVNVFKTAFGKIDKSYGAETSIKRWHEAVRNKSKHPISLDLCIAVVDIMRQIWPAQLGGKK